jgi:hypothetical protein
MESGDCCVCWPESPRGAFFVKVLTEVVILREVWAAGTAAVCEGVRERREREARLGGVRALLMRCLAAWTLLRGGEPAKGMAL